MIKVRPESPQINTGINSSESNGVGKNNVNNQHLSNHGLTNNAFHSMSMSKHLSSNNLKLHINGRVIEINGLQLGKLSQNNISSSTIIILNANKDGFSQGLQQNLLIAVSLLFETANPTLQSSLRNFSGQEITSSLLLTAGIFNEMQSIVNLKENNSLFDNSLLKQFFNNLSSNGDNSFSDLQIKNLWNSTRGIFNDCACAYTVEDLQSIAKYYANAMQNGDIDTLVKITELLKKGQSLANQGDNKLQKLLSQIVFKGEQTLIKKAEVANLNFLTNSKNISNTNVAKLRTDISNNTGVSAKDTLSEKFGNMRDGVDFYTEKTENTLRKQLDFYPHYAYERQISFFENPQVASWGEQEFIENYYSEIEDWLETGKHRLVKDFEFDKPLGMIVEREEGGFLAADKLRVVLVRDGSIEGWHFLRSFLIQ